MCNEVHPNIVVPFVIYECSSYYDKNKPTWEQMKKFAIDITPGPSKPRGFKVGVGFNASSTATDATDQDDEEYDDD